MRVKLLVLVFMIASLTVAARTQKTYAVPDPNKTITTYGTVFDASKKPVPGQVVVAWCGGILFFGGSDTTDASGKFSLTADGENCPIGSELVVVVYDADNTVLARGVSTVHTTNEVNLFMGDFYHYAVPEFKWLTSVLASSTGIAAVAVARKRYIA